MIAISKLKLGKEELVAVAKVLKSGQAVQGKKVAEFETAFAKYIGTKYAVAVSSGTAALHLSLLALGVGKGDEIITTPFSFIASANAILYVGAKPVFVDIDASTFNIDPELIEAKITKKTKAILPVHLFGLPCHIQSIMKIAKKHKLFVVEDACQAHGASFKHRKVGSFGDLGCFSFYATKNMTTIEGGMITTNDKQLYEKLLLLRNHGSKIKYQHEILGYNFRMTDINAAIGLAQFKKLAKFNKVRINNAKYLTKNLAGIKNLILPFAPAQFSHVFHQYTVRLNANINREKIIKTLETRGIQAGIYYPIPIHKQKLYQSLGYKDKLPVTENVARSVLSLPVHPYLTKTELKRIVFVISSILQ
jgi:dTDP-4-amino-4,6-dideoxygalactose transaminase